MVASTEPKPDQILADIADYRCAGIMALCHDNAPRLQRTPVHEFADLLRV
jgi:hypothetical protein